MYSRQEASRIRKEFWTRLGQYLAPIPGAEGLKVNWLNYKTGYKGLYFRMDADQKKVSIYIEMDHSDPGLRQLFFEQFLELKSVLHSTLNEEWDWQPNAVNELGQSISRIGKSISGVNIFDEKTWPKMIGFLKPRIISLDEFWSMAKDHFEALRSL
jgi:hypothetical protein